MLLGLRVTTDRNIVCYTPAALSHNATKSNWQQCQAHFEPRTKPARPAGSNAEVNLAERGAAVERVKSSPLKLYLEVAWLCNLRCPSCFHAYVPATQRKAAIHFMSPHLFRQIAEQLFSGAMMVWYNGNGETLLHPNAEAILHASRDYSFVPALLTSGSLFTERNMRLLVEGGFFLSVSVDSPEPRDFERLRAGARFDKLTAALGYLVELNRSIRNPRFNLRMQCVAQQSNLHQLADLVRWAHAYEAREVQFLPLQNFGHFSDYLEQSKLQHTPENANRQMLAAIRAGTALGVRVRPFPPFNPDPALEREFRDSIEENLHASRSIDGLYRPLARMAEHPSNNADRKCFMAWSECFIGVDGNVAPCDMYLDVTTVGNLYDNNFWDIWNGPQMAQMRRTVNSHPEALCRFGTCMFRN
jgi:radical SAM protein with 4Fe4S-binding SPASM domain